MSPKTPTTAPTPGAANASQDPVSCAPRVPELPLTSDPSAQTPLLPYVVARVPQGVLVRTAYPGSSTLTYDVVTYPAWGSLHAHVEHRAKLNGYELPREYERALKSAWMHLRSVWQKAGLILSPDAELQSTIDAKSAPTSLTT